MEQYLILQIGHVFYYTLAVLGLPANLVTLLTLQLRDCGLSRSTTIYLVAMATSDILVLIFYVLINRIVAPRFPYIFYLYTLACRLNSIMIAAVIDCSVWLTVSFTFDRFVAICLQGFKRRYCTPNSATVGVGTIYLLTYLRNIPYYFTTLHYYVYNNLQIGCRVNPDIDTVLGWRAFYWIHTILTPLVPYVSVALLNILTVRHILRASRVRRGFHGDGEGSGDPEMRSRRTAMVMLFAASASFILLWMPTVGLYLFSRITETYVYRDFNDQFAVINEASRMLRVLNCCTSTCMYALTQSKFRAELRILVRHATKIINTFLAWSK